jgi:DNA invertase Pin-like site-specific DNA recombinase
LGRRRGQRSRADIDEERKQLLEKTQREIAELVAESHSRLPRNQAKAIGVVYARYSTRFQDSIADQVRVLLDEAVSREIFVPVEHVFFDMAMRGYSDRRPGLQSLRETLAAKRTEVLLVFATNRLFRKTYKALQFVEEEVVEQGIRCIFVKSRIDTADGERWRTFLNLHATMDEFVVGMYAEHVRAGHEGLFVRGMVTTTLCLGYRGEPVEGELTKRKRPRCRIAIDEESAHYVRLVFAWFVDDSLALEEIARRLNADSNAPSPPKSVQGDWTHRTVRGVLANPRYRGEWIYGLTETKWQSKKDYVKQVPREEPLCVKQFEDLRIVVDEVWYAAQARLARFERRVGRKPKDGDTSTRPRLLNGIFYCPVHDRALYVGGPFGLLMRCPICRVTALSDRPLFTYLDRRLALELTCRRIAELIRADADLVARIIATCQIEAEKFQQPDPTRLAELQAEENRLARRIRLAIETLDDTDEEEQATRQLIQELRKKRADVTAELKLLEAAHAREIRIPSSDVVRTLLDELCETLVRAAREGDSTDAGRVRKILVAVTGGRIDLYQQGERHRGLGWLQGRFRLRVVQYAADSCLGIPADATDEGTVVVIDYKKPPAFEDDADLAWQLYNEGWLCKRIAERLGCSRSNVTKLLKYAAAARGVVLEDGRRRRVTLAESQMEPAKYRKIADQVKQLCDQGLLLSEIAEQLSCDRNTITQAIAYWHASRGLPVPDGRTRRKSLERKQRKSDE